ncbi:MAG: hypothetical protein ACPL4E_06830 [Thermoproteota archaeon]
MKRRVEKIAGKDFDVFIWPKSNSDIPDNKKLKLAILSFEFMAHKPETKAFIEDILTNYSTGYRTYKNTLMFLICDPNEYNGFSARAIEKTFSKDDERKNVVEIWEAFLKFPELPMLEGENVLKDALIKGVEDGVFGISMNEKVYYQETIPLPELTEDVFVLRKEIAQKEKEKVPPTEISVTPPPMAHTSPVSVPKGFIRKITLRVKVPWDKLSDMVRGVLAPLSREGAEISLEIKIDAISEKGISKDTIDLKVKETLNQIGAKVEEEKVE